MAVLFTRVPQHSEAPPTTSPFVRAIALEECSHEN
jgi:hypothetical protein